MFLAFDLKDIAGFLAFQVQTLGRNLVHVNLHGCGYFALKAATTQPGTKLVTSPPRRAISLMIRELRYVYSSLGIRKDRLDGCLELAVHQRHLEFELEIRYGAQAADDRARARLPRELDEQPVERHGSDFQPVRRRFELEQPQAILDAEERHLLAVGRDGDDHLVEELYGAFNDVEMPVGYGIETAGINGAPHTLEMFSRSTMGWPEA